MSMANAQQQRQQTIRVRGREEDIEFTYRLSNNNNIYNKLIYEANGQYKYTHSVCEQPRGKR